MSNTKLLADFGENVSETLKMKPEFFPEELLGVYNGFTPTDESPIGLGEFEISVESDKIIGRIATGLKIDDFELSLSELESMSNDEIAAMYKNGSDYANVALQGGKFYGFKNQNGLKFIFTLNPNKDEFGLIMKGSIADYLGPTILYSPSQVLQGLFKDAVENIILSGGDFPRLKYDGKNPPERL